MAYFQEGSEAIIALEAMIDKVGVRNVLYATASICNAKAEHIGHNWQDQSLAHLWNKTANEIGKVAQYKVATP